MRQPSLLALGLCLGAAACGGPSAAPFKPVADVKQLMDATVDPAARVYWSSVSTTVDKDGITEKFPKTDEEWEAVWGAAITIAESGNLLMMSPRARDNDEWMKWSARLVDIGIQASKAAEAKNPDLVLERGEAIYNVCTQCHMEYLVDVDEEAP